jgi:hypothetical protein
MSFIFNKIVEHEKIPYITNVHRQEMPFPGW